MEGLLWWNERHVRSGQPFLSQTDPLIDVIKPQVVKFGAYIVDALNAYKQPIMVYLPPRAELRGGSWVVIDPTINPSMMEMYSDPTACGGVLEPEAIVEIKYRAKDVRKTMERLDPVIKELMEEMGKSGVGATEKALLEERLKRREEQLAGVYHQVFHVMSLGMHHS